MNKQIIIPPYPYYVTCIDKFLSSVSLTGKKLQTNKLVFGCSTMEEAEIVADNARNRTDQKNVCICTKKPRLNPDHRNQFKDKKIYPYWYKKDYFA